MPIAASTDSSARRPWLRARGGRFGSRCASSVRAFATARGLRSSWATKLANRDSRRRSSSSLPTSRSSSTAPPPGIGVPSTSTITSRPDIGMRMTIRRRTDADWATTWGHSSRARSRPSSPRGSVERPHSSIGRSTKLRPKRRSAARLPYVPARLAVVHDQRLGDRLRDLLESRAIAFRLRASALERLAAGLDAPALGLEALLGGTAGGERLTGDLARHLGSIHEVDERRGAEDEGPEPDQVAPLECLHAAGLDEHEAKDRGRAGDVGGQGRHSAERQPDDPDGQHEQHDVRQMAPIRPGEPRPGQRGEDADDRAEQRVAEPRRGASPLSRRPRGSDAWRGRAVRAPSRCGATGSPRGAGRAPRDARRGRSRRAATTPGRPVPPR